ncbi:MAG: ATP-binding protein [Oscillospiraceae bacterium]
MKQKKAGLFSRTNALSLKLSLLVLIVLVAAEALTFTARLVIDFIADGTSDTSQVLGSVISSIIIGSLLAIIAGNIFLRPLAALIRETKKAASGDFSAHVDIGWSEKHTVREVYELIEAFNGMTSELAGIEMFRKDFISNFSHEFKTPLVSIRGFAKQFRDGGLTPEQQREFAQIILDETEYLSVLSANTLLLTNLENRDIVTERELFSLDEQLRSCMLMLEPQWSAKDIELDMDLESVEYFWNEQTLAHVWANLFDNAVKFTPNGGSIRVVCKKEGGGVIVTVSDSGKGISPEALPHIFEKFYQADSSHATNGNGLGLALVYRIIQLAGGTITAESPESGGAVFTVRLPLRKQV